MTSTEGFTKRTPAEWPELRQSPRAIVAQWRCAGGDLVLYEDGSFETDRAVPVDLLPYVQAEWHTFLRGKIA